MAHVAHLLLLVLIVTARYDTLFTSCVTLVETLEAGMEREPHAFRAAK